MVTHMAPSKSKKPSARGTAAARTDQREPQVNIRFSEETHRWLERRAGGRRAVPAYVRDLVERERVSEREAELLMMFNHAAEELTPEDREERRLFMQAHPNRD
jgi:hypothetical protein